MNEMKPEDVMRALECCENTENLMACQDCPYYRNYGTDGCVQKLIKTALALLREKDVYIKELEVELKKTRDALQDVFKDCDVLKEMCAEKDAEIERLNKEVDRLSQVVMYHDGQIADAQLDVLDEYVERAKRRLPIISPNVFDQIAKELKGEANDTTRTD